MSLDLTEAERKLAEMYWHGVIASAASFDGASEAERQWVTTDMVRRCSRIPPFVAKVFRKQRPEAMQKIYTHFAMLIFELERDLWAAHRKG